LWKDVSAREFKLAITSFYLTLLFVYYAINWDRNLLQKENTAFVSSASREQNILRLDFAWIRTFLEKYEEFESIECIRYV
jgi:hypothetical protein